jgi:hypothetical protein
MKDYLSSNRFNLMLVAALVIGTSFGILPAEAMAGASVMFVGSTSITAAFVQQWDTSIRLQAQQSESRLMKAVTDRGTISGDGFTINNLAAVEMDENTVRHGDTEWGDADHTNRLASMKDFYKALPLDRNDIPKMLVNPVTGGDYMRTLMNAKNRKIDKLIYNAMRGAITSKDGVTSYTIPAGQKIAHGSTGLTKAKLIQARAMFRANECDEEAGEELYIMYNDKVVQTILADTTLTSADYMAVGMLQSGRLQGSWMGFNWIPYQGLDFISSTYYAMAWAKSGVHFGKGYEEGKVSPRPDKKDTWQVSMAASYGAGRQAEEKIIEIAFQ